MPTGGRVKTATVVGAEDGEAASLIHRPRLRQSYTLEQTQFLL